MTKRDHLEQGAEWGFYGSATLKTSLRMRRDLQTVPKLPSKSVYSSHEMTTAFPAHSSCSRSLNLAHE